MLPILRACASLFASLLAATAQAQSTLSVSSAGQPAYSVQVQVPPGVGGMSPALALRLTGGATRGPIGNGWTLDGLSVITRCPAIRDTDGVPSNIAFAASDKLCLDGMRLIQTDASGNPLAFPQQNDALGQASGGQIEYRTEIDSFVRVRAYGIASGTDASTGPAWFRVWSSDGRISDYGAAPSADGNTRALVLAQASGRSVGMTWALARTGDALGNHIDYKYEQRDVAWGSGPSTAASGHEWNLLEIQYAGANKVVFSYDDARTDRSEAYNQGNKNVSIRRLNSITTYVNSPNTATLGAATGAVAVRTLGLTYDYGAYSKRSRLTSVRSCAGAPGSTKCLPPTSFAYGSGGSDAYQQSAAFAGSTLATLPMQNTAGSLGVIVADFNGDGKTDVLRWSNDPTQNQLFLSNGDGTFTKSTAFNVTRTTDQLFGPNACYVSVLADINGDGLPDILRYAATTDSQGHACPSPGASLIYINDGDGSFTPAPLQGVTLQRTASTTSASCSVTGRTVCKTTWTGGVNFYLIDFDGDGKADIVTSQLRAGSLTASEGSVGPASYTGTCASSICTHVYRGDGTGNFTDVTPASMQGQTIFTNPSSAYAVGEPSHVADLDGDGLPDFVSMMDANHGPLGATAWRSNGDGSFTAVQAVGLCNYPIDFNGDGRTDCFIAPTASNASNQMMVSVASTSQTAVGNFNLASATLTGTTSGMVVADINGDGRQDILHWDNGVAANTLYLSNGDGTFTASPSFNLGGSTSSSIQLQSTDGTTAFATGDFTGHGNTELLRVQTAANGTVHNVLLVKQDPTPPDLLTSMTSSAGATTTLSYVSGANSGGRAVSDRGTANASSGAILDLVSPNYLVSELNADSGAGSNRLLNEYAYFGLKANRLGRGLLGFREVRQQSPAADGTSTITQQTQTMLDYPYMGRVSSSASYLSDLWSISSANLLNKETTLYCDALSTASPTAAIAAGQSCTRGTNKIQQPYALYVSTSGFDLDRTPLPTSTTQNSVNTSGLVTQTVQNVSGSVAGSTQAFSTTTTNTPQPDVTSCTDYQTCSYQLARIASSTVARTAPGVLLPTSPGSAAYANATTGTGLPKPVPIAAIMSIIDSLLLSDN